eukprot:772193-Pelagomonas_calceolata.AAC.1
MASWLSSRSSTCNPVLSTCSAGCWTRMAAVHMQDCGHWAAMGAVHICSPVLCKCLCAGVLSCRAGQFRVSTPYMAHIQCLKSCTSAAYCLQSDGFVANPTWMCLWRGVGVVGQMHAGLRVFGLCAHGGCPAACFALPYANNFVAPLFIAPSTLCTERAVQLHCTAQHELSV